MMVDKVEAPDPTTVVFRLKFATTAFLPALADPFTFIYKKEILDKDPHWYEKNVMGSGPFKFVELRDRPVDQGRAQPRLLPQGAALSRRLHRHLRRKQATRVDAIRADRAAIEFRGLPPSARDELVKALGDKITVQESDWNCGSLITPNHKKKPFDDVRVRRALTLAIDRWDGAPALSKIADRAAPSAASSSPARRSPPTKEELQKIAGFWPDIEKSRAEAQTAAEGGRRRGPQLRAAEPQRRPALQICRHLARRRVEQDRAQGDAAGRADRPVVRGDAQRQFRRRRSRRNCHERRQPGARRQQVPAALGLHRELRQLRGPEGDRALRQDAARDRSGKAARADARSSRSTCSTTEAHEIVPDLVVPHRAAPLLRQGLEDQPEPLHQPGLWRRSGSTR